MRPARRRKLANVRLNALISHTASAGMSPRSVLRTGMAEKRAELLKASAARERCGRSSSEIWMWRTDR
jgi:hypothetical protein